MLQRIISSHGLLRRRRSVSALLGVVPSILLLAGGAAWAASPENGPVSLQFTIPVPPAATNATGGMYAFDISWVDQKTETYYLGDRSNAAVDAVDAATGTFLKHITASPPFAGVKLNPMTGAVDNSLSGPNGVTTGAVDGQNCLFAGDGPSRVVSFSLPVGTQVTSIKTGGTMRADEMAFDPKDSLLAVANNADTPPFLTLLHVSSKCALTIDRKIVLDKANGVDAQNGAEQAVWDPGTQRFYMSIPQVGPNVLDGGIARINPLTAKVETVFPVQACQPAGLALGPNKTFLAGCSMVFDTTGGVWSGTDANSANPVQVVIDTTGFYTFVPGIGSSDEVWYNAGDDHWYTGSSSSPYAPSVVVAKATAVEQGAAILGVVDGTSQSLDQLVPTFNVPGVKPYLASPGHPSGSSHSVAANAKNNWVLVPLPANNAILGCLTGCIGVYYRSDIDSLDTSD